ncbi:hypothetical protein D1178_07155 [Stenotrophomonas maltophilia]|nr:hypothetical protein D1178_07155 [Stenotrophomonas maltophilia]
MHSVSLSRLRAVGNGPDRSRQLLDFRQRGATGQVTAVMVGEGFGRAAPCTCPEPEQQQQQQQTC